MRGTLYIQIDEHGRRIKKPKPLKCEIDMGRDGTVVAGVGRRIVADLTRARACLSEVFADFLGKSKTAN